MYTQIDEEEPPQPHGSCFNNHLDHASQENPQNSESGGNRSGKLGYNLLEYYDN
jgi:hypothetical protein